MASGGNAEEEEEDNALNGKVMDANHLLAETGILKDSMASGVAVSLLYSPESNLLIHLLTLESSMSYPALQNVIALAPQRLETLVQIILVFFMAMILSVIGLSLPAFSSRGSVAKNEASSKKKKTSKQAIWMVLVVALACCLVPFGSADANSKVS